MLSVFESFVFVLWCDAFVLIVLFDEPREKQARWLVDRKQVKDTPPAIYCWPFQGGSSD